ncbi:ABC transporter B family member [Arachis hypogaea]|nr:ABC transporter B family member [Arachis hypogaea]
MYHHKRFNYGGFFPKQTRDSSASYRIYSCHRKWCYIASVWFVACAIKTFYEPFNELKKDSRFWALMFVTLGLASLIALIARGYFFSVAGYKLIQRIRLLCFEKVINMEVSWFDEADHSSGALDRCYICSRSCWGCIRTTSSKYCNSMYKLDHCFRCKLAIGVDHCCHSTFCWIEWICSNEVLERLQFRCKGETFSISILCYASS